ncbi:hypothetical protein KBI52_08495, partial [Microvirga sp. HBU67558]|uniref:hypothetical protein n=1 Tax=Microvirga sp. HBU67558 TaxID=2824562 RepID=UPI001B361BB3
GVEHNLAKVGVEGSNPFARSSFSHDREHHEGPPLGGLFVFAGSSEMPIQSRRLRPRLSEASGVYLGKTGETTRWPMHGT